MVKVLMCGNHSSNKGGMTTVISQVLEHNWEKDSIKIKFIPTYYRGIKILTVAFFALAYLKVLFTFIFSKPDVFYTHMSARGSFSRTKALHKLCVMFHVPDVIHLHGSEFEEWYNSETSNKKKEIVKLISECNTFIVLGKKWEQFVCGIAPNANIKIIHNCIKVPFEKVVWNDIIRFIYLGVLIPRKGVIDLLKAIKKLDDQNMINDCFFEIAGSGSEEEILKEYVNQNSLKERVDFLGWITGEEKNNAIKQSNVFILPSYNEGLPVSILEAMSFGLPVICTNVGDIPDAVRNDINGYLVTPGDINGLADCIVKVKSKEKWKCLSENSKRIAITEFNIDQFYSELLSVWMKCSE